MITPFTHAFLENDSIAHGFFGREGGVSTGLYRGLNCGLGSHDRRVDVVENRRRVATTLGQSAESLTTLYQIHSPTAVVVTEPFRGHVPEADAMVTNVPGITLGILTADCVPVLFADDTAEIIGAAHAGWKGATGGVLENTVDAMEMLGAEREDIRAVIGPCIAQASYEVGPEFLTRFSDAEQQQFFIPSHRPGHAMFDLPAYVALRLRALGLQHVAQLAMDTCVDEANFFSYRRATQRSEPDYGRHISCIVLRS
jgi:YfiH family protein